MLLYYRGGAKNFNLGGGQRRKITFNTVSAARFTMVGPKGLKEFLVLNPPRLSKNTIKKDWTLNILAYKL